MGSQENSASYMFDASLLNNLDVAQYGVDGKSDSSSYLKPAEGLILRPLSTEDFGKGFVDVLNQLTRAGDVTEESFQKRFASMKKVGDYYPLVVEDSGKGKIVATGTLIVEQKFIHSCATRGRVEEVVVDKDYRRMKLGTIILAVINALGQKLGCYKITLECKNENIEFYSKFGYVPDAEKFMQCRFRD